METLGILGLIYENLMNYTLIFTRIFTLLYTFSVFRREMATIRIIVSLSIILSVYVLLLSSPPRLPYDTLSMQYFMSTIVQTIIGFAGGLLLNIVIEIFTSLGQIISTQIGLSTASLFDPRFGMITSLTNFYIIVAIIIFLQMNGHLMVIETIVKSFDVIPVDKYITDFKGASIFNYAGVIFTGSVLISITVIAAIMMTNICLAMMSKFAPQFNLFSVGLNMSLLIGLICVFLSFQIIVDKGELYINATLTAFSNYLVSLGKS